MVNGHEVNPRKRRGQATTIMFHGKQMEQQTRPWIGLVWALIRWTPPGTILLHFDDDDDGRGGDGGLTPFCEPAKGKN